MLESAYVCVYIRDCYSDKWQKSSSAKKNLFDRRTVDLYNIERAKGRYV